MTTVVLHPLAAEYLHRLRRASRGLPSVRRRELLADIEGHLSEAIGPEASDAEALAVLDRLGEPEAIVLAERPDSEDLPSGRGAKEWATIVLLLFGGFLIGVGWLVGLVLLWTSRAWSTRDKWIGTLLVPGGLVISVFIGFIAFGRPIKRLCQGYRGGPEQCNSVVGQHTPFIVVAAVIFAFMVLVPIATSIYLARRASQHS